MRVSYCKVYAPCDGYVTHLQIAPGTYAAAGEQIFSVVDSSVWYMLANFRETDLAHIRPGQRATVFLMADGRRPIARHRAGNRPRSLSENDRIPRTPGGEGVFSRVQPTFDFVQLAQRFPVRIIVKDKEFPALRMGGKAAVVVDTQSQADSAELRDYSPREAFLPPAGP